MKKNTNTQKNISIEESMDAFVEHCNSYNGNCDKCQCSHIKSKPLCYMYFIKNVYNIDFFEKFNLKKTV